MQMLRRGLLLSAFSALVGPAAAAGASPAQEQVPATRQERLTSAESYLPMPTLTAGLLQRHSNDSAIVVDMGLNIPDEALRRRALLNAPRLRDALRTAISVYANTYFRDGTAPDPAQLSRLLQQATDRILGAPGAQVLLANIIYQRR
jgi:flagellar basal body-associated protein FliL